jgi:hypothetical protein
MPSSYTIAAFACGAVLLVGVYNAVFVASRLRALEAALARAGDGVPATISAAVPASASARMSVPAPVVPAGSSSGAAPNENGHDVAERLASLEAAVERDRLHVGFLRYNSFVDVGSDQSFTFALLGSGGDGIVVSSIFAREETRTYGKSVRAFVPQQDASQEEHAAIAMARRDGAFVRA